MGAGNRVIDSYIRNELGSAPRQWTWYLCQIVTRNPLCVCDGNFENDLKFALAVDLNKRPVQINLPVKLYTCAPLSELPSDVSTMTMVKRQQLYQLLASFFKAKKCLGL